MVIAAAVLVLFVAVAGVLADSNQQKGGQRRTFDVAVTHASKMNPSTLEPAHVGDDITVNMTSDTTGEVHLHGYDIAIAAVAGQTVSRSFKADKTCTCDIEWESTGTPLGALVVSP